jgi:SHS2 domain-containing protein
LIVPQPHSETEQARWEHFPHEADIGVRGIGSTREKAFEAAGLAVTAVVTDLASVSPVQAVHIACEAPDEELLLVDWLNALVYEMATRKMLFSRFTVHLNDHSLYATAWGERIEVARHQPAVEVKGATYTALSVKRDEEGRWIAQCVVDV